MVEGKLLLPYSLDGLISLGNVLDGVADEALK